MLEVLQGEWRAWRGAHWEGEAEGEAGQVWRGVWISCHVQGKPLKGFKPVTQCGSCFQKFSPAAEKVERKPGEPGGPPWEGSGGAEGAR